MNKDIIICGVGGQGTVLASKIIAASAMADGNIVHSAETIGMAQRGGPVTSHIRIGEKACSPLVPGGMADMILAFEPAEAVRNLGYLKKGGMVIVNSVPTKPVSESLHDTGYDGSEMLEYLKKKCDCIVVDADKECAPFGSVRYFNIMILGVATGSKALGISEETIINEIKSRVPEKFAKTNIKAFLHGCELGKKQG